MKYDACKVLIWSHSSAPNPPKHASLLLLPALMVHLGHKGVKRQKFLKSWNLKKRENFTLTPSRESLSVMLARLPCDNKSFEDLFTNPTKIGGANDKM